MYCFAKNLLKKQKIKFIWQENDGRNFKYKKKHLMVLSFKMERETRLELATPDLGKVVLYQLSYCRI